MTLRIAVNPAGQSGFVADQANSARFKYLLGQEAGVKAVLAQKLSVKPVPKTALVEAQIALGSKDQATRYAGAFVWLLQGLCGEQVQVTLAEQSIR